MSALRLEGSSLAGVGVVFFRTLLPSQAEKEYSSENSWASSLSRNMLVTTLSQFSTTFFTGICTE